MKQYLDLLNTIKEKGTLKPAAREGMPGTLSLFGYQNRHDLSEGFPLLTTKKIFWKGVVAELLWFLRGQSNLEFLHQHGVHIWDEDYENWGNKVKLLKEGDMGRQYPWLWRSWGKPERFFQPKPKLSVKFPNETPNHDASSKKIGQVKDSTSSGKFKILDYKNREFKIQFLETGAVLESVGGSNIDRGTVKDPYLPNVKGFACVGIDRDNLPLEIRRKLYVTWTNLLSRCYDEKHSSYPNYGGRGVYVDNRWLCFEFFVEDLISIQSWFDKVNNWETVQLDKDLLGDGYSYGPNKCLWLSRSINASETSDRASYYTFCEIATNKIYKTNNLLQFGEAHGVPDLNKVCSGLVSGKMHQYKGWRLLAKEVEVDEGVDQIKNVIESLRTNPMSRRHIVTAWNPNTLNDMALNSCHVLFQFNCRPIGLNERHEWAVQKGLLNDKPVEMSIKEWLDACDAPQYKLDCLLFQRSADVFLGVPFNIASYALLTEIIAQMCNMLAGDFIHDFGDVHIYENHIDQVNEQLTRTPKELPRVIMSNHINASADIDILEKLSLSDFELSNYDPMPSIKAELSTGLKK